MITSGETFVRLTGAEGYSLVLIQTTGDVTDENVQAIQNSVDQTYSFRDKRDERTTGTYMAFVFCVYAFLAIIALVTVMNIVNSISMSVSARMKQYGAMAIINLRDYYPFYTSDCFMEVSDEVAEMFKEFDRKEAAYRLRTYRHKAYYSLDRDDGLEHEAVFVALSPHELYERKVTMQELHAAIASLPDKQAKRIYAHFILGMTKQDIARAEGVHEKVVRVAIERGLRHLEKILKKTL